MQLFYHPDLEPSAIPITIELDSEESYHSVKVLRLRMGNTVNLTDGKGNLFTGIFANEDSKRCQVTVQSCLPSDQRSFHIHIAIAPTKNIDRIEWFLEKATEIGIDEISPIICDHSERTSIRYDRLQKILVSAMKQSMNLYLPKLNEPVKFNEFIRKEFSAQKFIAYVEEKQDINLLKIYTPGSDALILIGPEGDFSKKEISAAVNAGFSMVSLGSSRLRTETAGLVSCMMIHFASQAG